MVMRKQDVDHSEGQRANFYNYDDDKNNLRSDFGMTLKNTFFPDFPQLVSKYTERTIFEQSIRCLVDKIKTLRR